MQIVSCVFLLASVSLFRDGVAITGEESRRRFDKAVKSFQDSFSRASQAEYAFQNGIANMDEVKTSMQKRTAAAIKQLESQERASNSLLRHKVEETTNKLKRARRRPIFATRG